MKLQHKLELELCEEGLHVLALDARDTDKYNTA